MLQPGEPEHGHPQQPGDCPAQPRAGIGPPREPGTEQVADAECGEQPADGSGPDPEVRDHIGDQQRGQRAVSEQEQLRDSQEAC